MTQPLQDTPLPDTPLPEKTLLEICYQDEHIVAVNKHAGWLVHRSWLDRHETVVVMQKLRDQI